MIPDEVFVILIAVAVLFIIIFLNYSDEEVEPVKNEPVLNKRVSSEYEEALWSMYIGQTHIVYLIRQLINSMLNNNKFNCNILLTGASGAGKTYLSRCIAVNLSLPYYEFNGASVKTASDIVEQVKYMQVENESCVILVDEIHALPKTVMTELLTFLDDYKYCGIKVKPFVFIGATTELGSIVAGDLAPFERRFSTFDLQPYSDEETVHIILANKDKYEISVLADNTIHKIAKNSRNKAGIIAKIMELYSKTGDIDAVLSGMGIIEDGLTINDLRYLNILKNNMNQKNERIPISLVGINMALAISKKEIEYKIEPFLLAKGYISRTTKGRVLTQKGEETANYLNYLRDDKSSII